MATREINLNQEQPRLKIILPDNSGELLLVLKRVPNSIAKEFDTKTNKIVSDFDALSQLRKKAEIEVKAAIEAGGDIETANVKFKAAQEAESDAVIGYTYKLIEHMCDGFDVEKFNKIDSFRMQEIVKAVMELRSPDTAAEKKSG